MSSAQKVKLEFDTNKYDLIEPAIASGVLEKTLQPNESVKYVAKFKDASARHSWSIYKFTRQNV